MLNLITPCDSNYGHLSNDIFCIDQDQNDKPLTLNTVTRDFYKLHSQKIE